MKVQSSKQESTSVAGSPAKAAFWQFGSYESILNDTKYSRWAGDQDEREDNGEAPRGDHELFDQRDNYELGSNASIVNAPSEELQRDSDGSITTHSDETSRDTTDNEDSSCNKPTDDVASAQKSVKSIFDDILEDDDAMELTFHAEEKNKDVLSKFEEPCQSGSEFGLAMPQHTESEEFQSIQRERQDEQKFTLWGGLFEDSNSIFSSIFGRVKSPVKRQVSETSGRKGSILQPQGVGKKKRNQTKHVQWEASVDRAKENEQKSHKAKHVQWEASLDCVKDHEQECSFWDMIDNLFVHADVNVAGALCTEESSKSVECQGRTTMGKKGTIVDEWMNQSCCAPDSTTKSTSNLVSREERASLTTHLTTQNLVIIETLTSKIPSIDCNHVERWMSMANQSRALLPIPECSESMTNTMPISINSVSDNASCTSTISSGSQSQAAEDSSHHDENKVDLANTGSCANLNPLSSETPRTRNDEIFRVRSERKQPGKRDIKISTKPAKLMKQVDPPASSKERRERMVLPKQKGHAKKDKCALPLSAEPRSSPSLLTRELNAPSARKEGDSPFSPLAAKRASFQKAEASEQQQATTKPEPMDPPAASTVVHQAILLPRKKGRNQLEEFTQNRCNHRKELATSAVLKRTQPHKMPTTTAIQSKPMAQRKTPVEKAKEYVNSTTEKERLLKQMLPLVDLHPESIALLLDITTQQYLESSKCYDTIYEQTRVCVLAAESKLKVALDVPMISSILSEERTRFVDTQSMLL